MRKSIRLVVPAITASAVMLLGACSSDSDSEGEGGNPLEQSESSGGSGSEEGTDEGSGSEEGSGGGGGEVPSAADVEGGWSNVEQGLGLYITQGQFSVGNADGSMSCAGQYSESDGSLTGQCQDGSSFSGTASLNADTLSVQLETGDSYDFTRAGDMDIPEMPEVPDM